MRKIIRQRQKLYTIGLTVKKILWDLLRLREQMLH